jgi:hypothetical protein
MPLQKFRDELAALKRHKLKWSATGLVYRLQLDGLDARFDRNAITTFVDGIEPNREHAFKDPASLLNPSMPLRALVPLGTQKFEPAMGGWEIVVLAPADESFVTALLARYYEHFRRNGCAFAASAPDAPIVALKEGKRVGLVSPYCFAWSGPIHRAVAEKFGVATDESAPPHAAA